MNRLPRPARSHLTTIGIAPTLLLGLALAGRPAVAVQKTESSQQLDFGVKVALKGSWNEAAFRFQKAVDADASNPHAWCNLAVARESLGQIEAAEAAYGKAVALAPDDERIRTNYERFQSYVKSTRRGSSAP